MDAKAKAWWCGMACMAVLVMAGCGRTEETAAQDAAASPVSPAPSAPHAAAPAPLFEDAALGLSLAKVPGMQLRHDFRRDYLGGDGWKADADSDSRGTPRVALVMDGSNEVTAAELRIGASDTAPALAGCEAVPDFARPAGGETVQVDGIPFRHFTWSDAAMSHYMEVEAYRAVRGDHCLAIDLLLTGTRPEVYDPPRQPPFAHEAARAKLHEALAAVRLRDGGAG